MRPGDEWFGLPRAILRAGARAVIASQWDVDDAATAGLMGDVYASLSGGADPAHALASAQAAARAARVHPLDWAGFVVLGGPAAWQTFGYLSESLPHGAESEVLGVRAS